jgi:hypothetical protein
VLARQRCELGRREMGGGRKIENVLGGSGVFIIASWGPLAAPTLLLLPGMAVHTDGYGRGMGAGMWCVGDEGMRTIGVQMMRCSGVRCGGSKVARMRTAMLARFPWHVLGLEWNTLECERSA